jgi:hypothetical protein
MTKNKNYQKHGSKGGVKSAEKVSLGRTLFRSRFGNQAKEVGELNKDKWVISLKAKNYQNYSPIFN